jgi:hypothetical protein
VELASLILADLRQRRVAEDLPGKWHAAILTAEQNRPKLRLVSRD